MRRFLWILIVAEALALVGGAGVLIWNPPALRPRPPQPAVFRPVLNEAVIGDQVRYRRLDAETGEVLGYVDYVIEIAQETQGTTLGREFILAVTDKESGGRTRSRRLRIRPRSNEHGFLPPIVDEEQRFETPGASPVIRTIRTADVPFRRGQVPGFLVEAVVPRESLTEVRERFWITEKVPVFGVSRWERPGEVLEVHTLAWGRDA